MNFKLIEFSARSCRAGANSKRCEDKLEKAINILVEAERALEETESVLEVKYNGNLISVGGDVLNRQLQTGDRKRNQPQVVKRADFLPGKITRYRF